MDWSPVVFAHLSRLKQLKNLRLSELVVSPATFHLASANQLPTVRSLILDRINEDDVVVLTRLISVKLPNLRRLALGCIFTVRTM